MAKKDTSTPIPVRIVELPEAFTTLVQSLADRLTAMEAREDAMRKTIAELQGRIDAMGDTGGRMMLGSSGPVINPMSAAAHDDTDVVDAGEFVQALGEQILAGSDNNSDFTIDNLQIDLAAGLGKRGDRAQVATNARQQAVSQNTSRITFSVRRRTPTQIIE